MKRHILIIMIITLGSSLFSYSIMNRITGNTIMNLDARSTSMGSAAITGGDNVLQSLLNPSNLSSLHSKISVQSTGNFLLNQDNRALPMYNSFDAYSDDATYVSNVNIFDNYAFGACYQHAFPEIELSGAFLYHPVVNFDADYFEQVRNNANSDYNSYPPIIAKNSILSSGNIDGVSFMTSFKYHNLLSLGFRFSKLKGNSELERKIIWSDDALEMLPGETLQDTTDNLNRDFNGFQMQIGARFEVTPRIDLGCSFTPKTNLDVTGSKDEIDLEDAVYVYTKYDSLDVPTDSLTFADYSLPLKFRFGFNYKPRNIMRTNFNVDIEYIQFSQVNPLYDDAVNYYLGIEHKLDNSIPLRLGFNYRTDYCINQHENFNLAKKVIMPTFTVGSGFSMLDNFTIDLSLEYMNRQYETLDLFMDGYYDYEELWSNYDYLSLEDRGWENPDSVKESFFKLQTSISYKW